MIVIVTDHWESKSEPGWITRQVAGALACEAEVHVVTEDASPGGTATDSVFTVHPWGRASSHHSRDGTIAGLRPERIVVVGRRWDDITDLTARADVDFGVTSTVLALAAEWDDAHPTTIAPILGRARSVMVVTEGGRAEISSTGLPSSRVHRVGAPMAANPSARSEPDPRVDRTSYLLVHTGVDEGAARPENELGQLLRIRFPDQMVAVLHTDAFCVWQGGRVKRSEPVRRSSDMARLMAWAHLTVDLQPGRLFARRCIESLLYGTPIVVPHGSRAREHAERGRGGLWFTDPTGLVWCVEALLDSATRNSLGAQGRTYAEAEYGSTDQFIHRVLEATGLVTPSTGDRDHQGVRGPG
jgi:hypothetical protein